MHYRPKNGEQLVPLMPAIKEVFGFLGRDMVALSRKNDALKNQIGDYDGKWLEESKTNLLKQINDEKTENIIVCGLQKQMIKH